MARHSAVLIIALLLFTCGIYPIWSLKCRADDEVANEEDFRDAVRVCMSNLTNERDEQGFDSGGTNSGGGSRRPRPKGDSNGGGSGSRRPGRPYRPGSCDSGSYGGNRDGYGNNGGYGGSNNRNNGGFGSNGGFGGSNGGGYGDGYYGYQGGPQRRGPLSGGSVMQGGPVPGSPVMQAGPMPGGPLTGRSLKRRSSGGYSGNDGRAGSDGRITTALDNVDACVVHCIFRQMHVLNENAKPDKENIIRYMTQRVRDRELTDFIQDSVDECFVYSREASMRSLNKCEFSKKLALCLEEKAKRHCDDWEEDGNLRGDQRGDRDRGPNGQRPPRQHYVGR